MFANKPHYRAYILFTALAVICLSPSYGLLPLLEGVTLAIERTTQNVILLPSLIRVLLFGSGVTILSACTIMLVSAIAFWVMHRKTGRDPSLLASSLIFAVIWTLLHQIVSYSDHIMGDGVYYHPGSPHATTPEPIGFRAIREFLINLPLVLLACYWARELLGLRTNLNKMPQAGSPPDESATSGINNDTRTGIPSPPSVRMARFFKFLTFVFWGGAVLQLLAVLTPFPGWGHSGWGSLGTLFFVIPACLILGIISFAAFFVARSCRKDEEKIAQRSRDYPYPRCPKCYYVLVGLSEQVCPDCGRPFTFEELGDKGARLKAQMLNRHEAGDGI